MARHTLTLNFTRQRQLARVIIAPHRRLAAGNAAAFRHVIPAVWPVINAVQQQALMLFIGGEIRLVGHGGIVLACHESLGCRAGFKIDDGDILLAQADALELGPEGGSGGGTVVVQGTPETVAQALLDYYDLGVDILSARGYDMVNDTIDFGRHVIPIVREEVAKRDRERAAAVPEPREIAVDG